MFDKFFAVIAPHECLQCGLEGSLWCDVCRSETVPPAARCYKCHRLSVGGRTCLTCRRNSPLSTVQATNTYSEVAKALVWKLKFDGAQEAAKTIAKMMHPYLESNEDIIITFAPTTPGHVRSRGYDQARLIAIELAKLSGLPLQPCLTRMGHDQQRGASRQQRITQLSQAFRVPKFVDLEGSNILVIDDVITTGATLEAAAETLKSAGAKRVSALVFAQA